MLAVLIVLLLLALFGGFAYSPALLVIALLLVLVLCGGRTSGRRWF
jgi:hypothetical protein